MEKKGFFVEMFDQEVTTFKSQVGSSSDREKERETERESKRDRERDSACGCDSLLVRSSKNAFGAFLVFCKVFGRNHPLLAGENKLDTFCDGIPQKTQARRKTDVKVNLRRQSHLLRRFCRSKIYLPSAFSNIELCRHRKTAIQPGKILCRFLGNTKKQKEEQFFTQMPHSESLPFWGP